MYHWPELLRHVNLNNKKKTLQISHLLVKLLNKETGNKHEKKLFSKMNTD